MTILVLALTKCSPHSRFRLLFGTAISLIFVLGPDYPARAAETPQIAVIHDTTLGRATAHGIAALEVALRAKGIAFDESTQLRNEARPILIVAGVSGSGGAVDELAKSLQVEVATKPESLLVRRVEWSGKQTLLVMGSDDRGLMYGLLDIADRVGWAKSGAQPFSEVRDADETPFATERALSMYTFNRAYWESRFYDEAYWAKYLDTLARNRFNSLVVIFGYENGGFLAPCYPYFFDVEGFPDVRMVGITPGEQHRNLFALNRLIRMAHERGLRFTVGIWDHIYRGGVQGGGIPGADEVMKRPTPGLVWGVTADNLVPYTKAALAKLVKQVPELDGIQFRMHYESGLKNSEQGPFWRDVFQRMKQAAPNLHVDLRAKELPDSVIQSALDIGVPFRIATKYWMEQMGLPFHPTHINKENQFDRRHSYADMLRYPQRYHMHWRLWNGGTARVLLWGDPDYARRFVESTRLYDGDGFEVNEPLCTKMEAQPHDAKPFDLLNPAHRYYDYEFERYWHFFQVFGRLGYNTNASPEIWRREFEKRFGPDAAPSIERALHGASWVLPRIVASCYPYSAFPMTRGWAEKQRLGDLPAYARAEGSDIQQFASFDEEAQLLLDGGETAKLRPSANSRWFTDTSAEINANVTEAEKRIGSYRNKEFDSTITDLKILSCLALYHSRRIPAAVNYRLFERTRNPEALGDAIAQERTAVEAWRQLVTSAGDFYAPDLMMGVRGANLSGHWKDELAALEKGLASLERQQRELKSGSATRLVPRFPLTATIGDGTAPEVIHQPTTAAPVNRPITITARVSDPAGVKWVHLRYRSVNQHQDYRALEMVATGDKDQYRAVIPAEQIPPTWDLMYFIEAMDKDGNGRIYPDFNQHTPYVVVKLQRRGI